MGGRMVHGRRGGLHKDPRDACRWRGAGAAAGARTQARLSLPRALGPSASATTASDAWSNSPPARADHHSRMLKSDIAAHARARLAWGAARRAALAERVRLAARRERTPRAVGARGAASRGRRKPSQPLLRALWRR
jgi:hypothetical protein